MTPANPRSDRFTDWSTMGLGAEGRLFRARDRWRDHIVALKVAASNDALESLIREYLLLSSLKHPCVIDSLELVKFQDRELGHMLEYLPVVNPARIWEEGGEEAVLSALIQAWRGLSYIHRSGYVHCDVTPSNVLVWKEGDAWRAKVADFGLALDWKEAKKPGIRGTVGYMSPEAAHGTGVSTASDYYSLAITAVSWIDGENPWRGKSTKEMLKGAATAGDVPLPRRQVSPQLLELIKNLGRTDPESRTLAAPEQLRRQRLWGPPVLQPGIHGLERIVATSHEWIDQEPDSPICSQIISGPSGSGRRTLAKRISAHLAGAAWASFPENPLDTLKDWIDADAIRVDPVRVVREMVRRFDGDDVVLVWSPSASQLESQAFRGFLASRSRAHGRRTCVLKVAPEDLDADSQWLQGISRSKVVEWRGPGRGALETMVGDLFPPEDPDHLRVPQDVSVASASPLSLVTLKRGMLASSGKDASSMKTRELREELEATWATLSDDAKSLITILCWSDAGWGLSDLTSAADLSEERGRAALELVNGLHITDLTYAREVPALMIRDWLTRTILKDQTRNTQHILATRLADLLESSSVTHEPDLAITHFLTINGVLPRGYASESLKAALRDGKHEGILEVWKDAQTASSLDKGGMDLIGRAALLAAEALRRIPEKVEILREMLQLKSDYDLRMQLIDALAALGSWQDAIAECVSNLEHPDIPEETRFLMELRKAELHWQSGEFKKAVSAYEDVGPRIPREMESLKFRWYVGMARQAGQQGEFLRAREILDDGIEGLGLEAFTKDPVYLHTAAGLAQATESTTRAVELAERAVATAELRSDWPTYVMATARLSLNRRELGSLPDAIRTGSQGEATALALGSQRMAAMSGSSLGAFLAEEGRPKEALDKARWAMALGGRLGDGVLKQSGAYLLALIGAYYNLEEDFDEACLGIGNKRYTEGMFIALDAVHNMVRKNWKDAYEYLKRALERATATKSNDTIVEYNLLMTDVCRNLRLADEAAAHLEEGIVGADTHDIRRFVPIGRLLGAVDGKLVDWSEVEGPVEDLWASGAMLAICFWSPVVVPRLSEDKQATRMLRRRIVGAFQHIASHCKDERIKRAFLSAPRYRSSLEMLRG